MSLRPNHFAELFGFPWTTQREAVVANTKKIAMGDYAFGLRIDEFNFSAPGCQDDSDTEFRDHV